MSESERRGALVDTARAMNRAGLSRGTSGNVSVRVDGGMLITPSAVPYEDMGPDDVVRMRLDGTVVDGGRKPSTEWRLHAGILEARPQVGAVLHAHPEFSTALACLRREIPPVHYMVAVAGGSTIRCAPYATFGTPELAANTVAALEDRTACLLANHGLVTLGASPTEALALAVEVEALAAVYWRALQVGEPASLSEAEMAEIRNAFEEYRAG
ncbi:MAG: class II aldolase/adducin family protein [Longimicrobiales bacterium]|nr:class II aldolase/adducin family protein [Longimicrobiales bacterium]